MHTTPVSLLERLQRTADSKAWDEFVELYTPLLYYWVRRTGLQETDAADVVQEVLVLLFRKLPEYRHAEHRSFRGWLRTVTLNKWRELRRRPHPVTLADGSVLAELPAPDEQAAFEEKEYRQQLVRQALLVVRNEYSPATWNSFQQYVLAGRRAEDVAAELGVAVGTVYATKSRVLSRLRRKLDGLLD